MDIINIIKKSLFFVIFSYFIFTNNALTASESISNFKKTLSNKIKNFYHTHKEVIQDTSIFLSSFTGFTVLYLLAKQYGYSPKEHAKDALGECAFFGFATAGLIFLYYKAGIEEDKKCCK